jgi:hypothetical protein
MLKVPVSCGMIGKGVMKGFKQQYRGKLFGSCQINRHKSLCCYLNVLGAVDRAFI